MRTTAQPTASMLPVTIRIRLRVSGHRLLLIINLMGALVPHRRHPIHRKGSAVSKQFKFSSGRVKRILIPTASWNQCPDSRTTTWLGGSVSCADNILKPGTLAFSLMILVGQVRDLTDEECLHDIEIKFW